MFTLVGIAGEDDLDAPDLIAPKTPAAKSETLAGNKKAASMAARVDQLNNNL